MGIFLKMMTIEIPNIQLHLGEKEVKVAYSSKRKKLDERMSICIDSALDNFPDIIFTCYLAKSFFTLYNES